jgi:hypothetical protein
MKSPQSLLAMWRETARQASEAESALFEATMAYTSGRGPKPSDESMEEARRLRASAGELLDEAMQQFGGGMHINTRKASPDQHGQH